MADYDFTPKVNPMQGVSLADMVAAKQSPLTSVLKSIPASLQALQQQKQQQQMMSALGAMQQPGIAEGKSSLTADQMMALYPKLGEKAFQLGEGYASKRELDFKKEKAQTEDILAQAEQRRRVKSGDAFALTPEDEKSLQLALDENRLAPTQMTYRGPKLKMLARMFQKNPKFNAIQSDIGFFGGRAESTALGRLRGGKAEEVAAMAGTVEDTLDYIEPMIENLSPTQIQMINSAYMTGLAQINDEEANTVLGAINEATALQATVLHGGGTPTDADLSLARAYIRPGIAGKGFRGVKKAVNIVNTSRVRRLKGLENNIPPSMKDKKSVTGSDPLGIL